MTTETTDSSTGSSTDHLADRYGRTPGRHRRDRVIGWVLGIGIALVFVVWVVWVAFDGTGATIEARDIGHKIVDDRTVSVTFEVSMPPGSASQCALEAQNQSHAIVGWKVIELDASDTYTRTFTTTVRTTEMSVTGLIKRCWLV